MLSEIVEAWTKSEIEVPGHARPVARPYKPNDVENKLAHHLTFVDPSGKLQLAESHVQKLLDRSATGPPAEDFWNTCF